MMYRLVLFCLIAPAMAVLWSACDSEKDCVTLCEEAQDGDCTSISGDCSSFCSALDNLGACEDERDAYEECLGSESAVCDSSCSGDESSLTNCGIAFCQNNLSNENCQTLAASFL